MCDFGISRKLDYLPTDLYCLEGYEGTVDFSHGDYDNSEDFKFVNLYLNDFYCLYLVAEPKEIPRTIYRKKNGVVSKEKK